MITHAMRPSDEAKEKEYAELTQRLFDKKHGRPQVKPRG